MFHARWMKTVLFFMALAPGAVAAQNCGDLQSQSAMNRCAAEDYANVDRALNRVYDAYRARLGDEQQRQLREAQSAWVRFRDLSCQFESSAVKRGSAYPLILQSCLARMTRARLRQLSILADCQEGDLSCPASK
jgi:uncharacterized protein YecT (DUF1311 family)